MKPVQQAQDTAKQPRAQALTARCQVALLLPELPGGTTFGLVMLLACFVMFLRPGSPGGATETLATDTDIVLVVDTTATLAVKKARRIAAVLLNRLDLVEAHL